MMNIKELLAQTDSLTYLNALKVAITELKEEHSTIQETQEYQNQAIERSKRIIRRIDNQYRAIAKCAITGDSIGEASALAGKVQITDLEEVEDE